MIDFKSYAVAFLVPLFACASASEPVDPAWNKQPCAHCHMLVSEPRTAAQLVTRAGERSFFDDVGCLAEHLSQASDDVAAAWVRDARGSWSLARSARYRSGDATPMGYGIVADAGGPLRFEQVQREIALHRVARSTP